MEGVVLDEPFPGLGLEIARGPAPEENRPTNMG
jgi:hypothetical protein